MKMYREPLNYSVCRGFWNDNNDFIRQELIAYFSDADRAKAYAESLGEEMAVFNANNDAIVYPRY